MPLLQLKHVIKRFGGVYALRDVNFSLEPGEIHALIGPNGSGKSNCVNTVSGIYMPTKGEIIFKGKSIGGVPPHRLARMGLTRTFQNLRLFKKQTALENVLVAAEVEIGSSVVACLWRGLGTRKAEDRARAQAKQALEAVGLERDEHLRAESLPYGKQRLLEIARAIVTQPDLLLLDEPAAGLNPEETLGLTAKVRGLRNSGITILLAEHKMSMVMTLADRITVLDFGEKIAEGTPPEVRANEKVIEAYLGKPDEELQVDVV